jgi:hypothetical protein
MLNILQKTLDNNFNDVQRAKRWYRVIQESDIWTKWGYIRRQKAWKETKKKFLLKGTITETKKDHRGI